MQMQSDIYAYPTIGIAGQWGAKAVKGVNGQYIFKDGLRKGSNENQNNPGTGKYSF
jgi:hypothetical protein